jgi:hypothetical protein
MRKQGRRPARQRWNCGIESSGLHLPTAIAATGGSPCSCDGKGPGVCHYIRAGRRRPHPRQ